MTVCLCIFFFKKKTAYEMRISDWSSDVCSSDLFWLLYSVQNKRPRFYKKYLYGLWQTRVYPVPFQLKFRFLKRIFYSKKRKFNRRKWKTRSEERRVGKEGVSTCRSRWSR